MSNSPGGSMLPWGTPTPPRKKIQMGGGILLAAFSAKLKRVILKEHKPKQQADCIFGNLLDFTGRLAAC